MLSLRRSKRSGGPRVVLAKRNSKPRENTSWTGGIAICATAAIRDDLSDLLARRKQESGWQERADIQTMFDYLDADDGRL